MQWQQEAPPGGWRRLGLGLALLLGLAGCPVALPEVCPRCAEVVVGEPVAVPAGTRVLYVLIPGLLGYGWEWNGAQIALQQIPDSAAVVCGWDPWQSLNHSRDELLLRLRYLYFRLPASVREVVIIGHSAAGLLVMHSAGRLTPPPGRTLRVLVVGAPLAGNALNLYGDVDMWGSPLPIALGGRFATWPAPPPGVRLEVYPTGPSDPVMRRHFGHDPADPRVLPPGAVLRPLPRDLDHNRALTFIAEQLLSEARAAARPR